MMKSKKPKVESERGVTLWFQGVREKRILFTQKVPSLKLQATSYKPLLFCRFWRFYCISLHVSCATSASRPGENKQELRIQLQRLQTEVSRYGNTVISLKLVLHEISLSQ